MNSPLTIAPDTGLWQMQDDGAVVLPGDETLIDVPSGQPVTLLDVIWNTPGPEGLTMRFRFLAPQIAQPGGTISFDQAVEDMKALCQTYALPRLATPGPVPSQIIISLSDIPVPFGAPMPDATQFFEAFSIENGACKWEIY